MTLTPAVATESARLLTRYLRASTAASVRCAPINHRAVKIFRAAITCRQRLNQINSNRRLSVSQGESRAVVGGAPVSGIMKYAARHGDIDKFDSTGAPAPARRPSNGGSTCRRSWLKRRITTTPYLAARARH